MGVIEEDLKVHYENVCDLILNMPDPFGIGKEYTVTSARVVEEAGSVSCFIKVGVRELPDEIRCTLPYQDEIDVPKLLRALGHFVQEELTDIENLKRELKRGIL